MNSMKEETLQVRILFRQGVLCTTLCDKVCQWLATGRWFSPVSSTYKTDRHDIWNNVFIYSSSFCMRFFHWVMVMVFYTTFNNISVISWRSVTDLIIKNFLLFKQSLFLIHTGIFLMNSMKEETLQVRIRMCRSGSYPVLHVSNKL
jgi:hypothetical protein